MLNLLISSIHSERYTQPVYNQVLKAGKYNISCEGAKGGAVPNGGKGGPGATGYGILNVVDQIKYSVVPGSQGNGQNRGNPDGGYGYGKNGGGGGSSSFLLNDIDVLKCAGGGGAYDIFDGSPGGDLENFYRMWDAHTSWKFEGYGDADNRDQSNGDVTKKGSGGGGGHPSGLGGFRWIEQFGPQGPCHGCGLGGKSYVDRSKFIQSEIKSGLERPNNGDGYIEIVPIYQCTENCKECNSASNCISCRDNFKLNNGICSCPIGTFLNTLTNQCQKCIEGCKKCSSENQCDECSDEFEKVDNQCQKQCSQGQYMNGNECSACPEGYVLKDELCVQCMNGCKRCNTTDCLECSSPSMQLRNGKCLQKRTFGFNEHIDGIGSFQVFARRINNR